MPIFECVTIGLALTESDNHLIEYAAHVGQNRSRLKKFSSCMSLQLSTRKEF